MNVALPPAVIAALIILVLVLVCCFCAGCVCLYAIYILKQKADSVQPSAAEKASLMSDDTAPAGEPHE